MTSVASLLTNYDLQQGVSLPGTDKSEKLKKLACTFCKKRKIKCDRAYPCSSCLKYKNSTCEYVAGTNKRISKKRILENEVDMLKSKILKLEKKDDPVMKNGSYSSEFVENNSPYGLRHISNGFPTGMYGDTSSEESSSTFEFQSMELNFLMHDSADEEFDIFKDQETSTYLSVNPSRAYGPLSWRGMCNLDPALKLHWDYYTQAITKMLNNKSASYIKKLDDDLATFRKCIYKNVNVTECFRDRVNFVSFFRGANTNEDNAAFMDEIKCILPPRKVLWALIDVFISCFTFSHQIIHEEDFRRDMSELLGGSYRDFSSPDLNFKSIADTANAGILLICLRFGYLTLQPVILKSKELSPSHILYVDSDVKEYLLAHPIEVNFIEYSESCLSRFNLLDPCCFEGFFLLVFSYLYKCFGPEHGIEPNNVEVGNMRAFILQVAYSMGLNRNPTTKHGIITPFDRLGRHIWSQLVFDDICTSLGTGHTLIHNAYPYDEADFKFDPSLFPITTDNMSSVELKRLKEAQVFMMFNQLNKKVQDITKDFLMKLTDPTRSLTAKQVFKFLENLEIELIKSNGILDYATSNFKKVADLSEDFFRSFVLKVEILFKFSTVPYYFKLFNMFEKKGEYDLACYCLKKIISNQLINYDLFHEVANNDEILSILLIPQALGILHRNLLVNLSINVRLQIINERDDLVKILFSNISKNTQLHFGFIEKLLDKYYYAWYIKMIVVCGFATSERTIKEVRGQELNFSLDFPMFKDANYLQKVNELYENSNNDHMRLFSRFKPTDEMSSKTSTETISTAASPNSCQFPDSSTSSHPSSTFPDNEPNLQNEFSDVWSYLNEIGSDFVDYKVADELLREINLDPNL